MNSPRQTSRSSEGAELRRVFFAHGGMKHFREISNTFTTRLPPPRIKTAEAFLRLVMGERNEPVPAPPLITFRLVPMMIHGERFAYVEAVPEPVDHKVGPKPILIISPFPMPLGGAAHIPYFPEEE